MRTSRHVAASIHDDGLVLLHKPQGRLFASNRAGAQIWRALERHTPVEDIARAVSDRYGIPYDTAMTDVDGFLAALVRNGLVERRTQ